MEQELQTPGIQFGTTDRVKIAQAVLMLNRYGLLGASELRKLLTEAGISQTDLRIAINSLNE